MEEAKIHINNICWGCPPICGAGYGNHGDGPDKVQKVGHDEAEKATCKTCRKKWGLKPKPKLPNSFKTTNVIGGPGKFFFIVK